MKLSIMLFSKHYINNRIIQSETKDVSDESKNLFLNDIYHCQITSGIDINNKN